MRIGDLTEEEIQKFPDIVMRFSDGTLHFDENFAAAWLLTKEIVFVYERHFFHNVKKPQNINGPTIVLFVSCNDVFLWGAADAECVTLDELEELFCECVRFKSYGSARWVCKKRQMKPQEPLEKMMKDAGAWDDIMENLPDNEFQN